MRVVNSFSIQRCSRGISAVAVAALFIVLAVSVAFIAYIWVASMTGSTAKESAAVSALSVQYVEVTNDTLKIGVLGIAGLSDIRILQLRDESGRVICQISFSRPITVRANEFREIIVPLRGCSITSTRVRVAFLTSSGEILSPVVEVRNITRVERVETAREATARRCWLSGWRYRVNITIIANIRQEIRDVQIKIVLTRSNFRYWDRLASLTFAVNCNRVIPYWIQEFDRSRGHAVIWIKLPVLRPGRNVIHLYFNDRGTLDRGSILNVMTRLPARDVVYEEYRTYAHFVRAGTRTGWTGDDVCRTYTLPFTFPFYDLTVRYLRVCSNGYIVPQHSIPWWSRWSDWTSSTWELKTRRLIAPFWADLYWYGGRYTAYIDANYHDEFGRGVYIRWVTKFYPPWRSYTGEQEFAVVLYQNGIIKFMYDHISGRSWTDNTPVIGVSRGDRTHYTLSSMTDVTDWSRYRNLVIIFWPRKALDLNRIRIIVGSLEQLT